MKKLVLLLPLLLLLILGIINRNEINNSVRDYVYFSPCDTPILYSAGEIDSRFNLSSKELLRRAKVAAEIWEKAYGKQLFKYDPNSVFTINAVYDERQELSTQTQDLDGKLQEENTQITERVTQFKKRVDAYKTSQDSLNTDIQYWNERGGAPEDEYNSLRKRQEKLETEAQDLQKEAESLNASSDEFNSQAQEFSDTISKFNDVLKIKPEGGIYTQNGSDKQITIYFNNSEKEFIYTMAHEMGHSLGLPHNSNAASIMYPKINNALIPSSYDLKDLQIACAERSIFELYIQNIQHNLMTLGLSPAK